MPWAFNDHLLRRQAPSGFSRKACATKKNNNNKRDALWEPRPCPRMPQARKPPGPPAPTKPRGEAGGRSEPRAGRSSKGLSAGHPAKAPRAPVMQRGCIACFPACPAHPEHGHSPTPAAPARTRRWRLQGRALRLRSGSLGERASLRGASGDQGACAARRTIPGRRWEEGLRDSRRLPSSRRVSAPRLKAPLDLVQSAARSVERSGGARRSGRA